MPERVFIARVDSYDHTAIREAALRGLSTLGVRVPDRLLGKPNWVAAHATVAAHCYTRPEHLRGAIAALFEKNVHARIALAGNSGAGVPTKVMAARARGEAAEFRRRGALALPGLFAGRVEIAPTDGDRHLRYQLSQGDALSDRERAGTGEGVDPRKRYWRTVRTSARLLDCEALVFFPKLKTNVLSHGVTAAIKLQGIGFLLDEDRMDGHNYHNHRRIVDMLEVAEPDLIITDAIEIGFGGNQMTERGERLGAIIVATNCVAHDAVCARILGLDPTKVDHIRIAHERGYGPIAQDEIEVVGDCRLQDLVARTSRMGGTGFMPVVDFPRMFREETLRDLPLEVLAEPPWDVAGSHGLMLDWLYMSYDFAERRLDMASWPPATLLVGGFAGKPPAPKNGRVYVIGDRAIAAWRRLGWGGRGLSVPRFLQRIFRGPSRYERYQRPDGSKGLALLVPGDPPTHRDVILSIALGTWLRVRPPLLRLDLFLDSYVWSLATKLRRWWRNRGGVRTVGAEEIARLHDRKEMRREVTKAALPSPAMASGAASGS